jgi:hypothetical protein
MASPQRTVSNPQPIGVASAGGANYGHVLGTDNLDGTFTLIVAGSGTGGVFKLPYAGSPTGQALFTNSYIGVGGTGGGAYNPLQVDGFGSAAAFVASHASGLAADVTAPGTAGTIGGLAVQGMGTNGAIASTIAANNVPAQVVLGATLAGTTSSGYGLFVQGSASGVPIPVTLGAGDSQEATYFASFTALAGVAGICIYLPGSATKIVRLRRVFIGGVATTAAFADMTLVKYSTAPTAGTTVVPTIGAMDSNNATGSAAPVGYSVAPTPGTAVGIILATKVIFISSTASTTLPHLFDKAFSTENDQAPTLRGVAQGVGLVLSAAPTGGSIDGGIIYTESST